MSDVLKHDPRFDPPGVVSRRDDQVPLAATLLQILLIYAGGMAVPLILCGAMMNEMMFIGGLIHLSLAALFFAAWKGLLTRKRWARGMATTLAMLGVIVPSLAIVGTLLAGPIESGALVFLGIITIYFAVLLWAITRPSLVVWLGRGI